MRNRTFWKINFTTDSDSASSDWAEDETIVAESDANAVSSMLDNGQHAPAIDIDLPCELRDSKTPGHHHLLIDKQMTWEQYVKLLTVMVEVGIVEKGYLSASMARRQTFLRIGEKT